MPKTYKKRKERKSYRKKGGCGCGGSKVTGGGNDFFLPGYIPPESINGLPLRSFYPQNTYNDDPQGNQVNTRLLKGGKRRKKSVRIKRRSRKSRKGRKSYKKGGAFSDYLNDPLGMQKDPISSFGNISGAVSSNNLIQGLPVETNTIGVRSNISGITMV